MKTPTLVILTLVVLTFGVYVQVHNFEFVNFDDRTTIANNIHIRDGLTVDGVRWAFTSAYAANWFPVTWISHMVDVQMYGFDSGWHHLTNVMIHTAAAVLLFLLFRRMTGRLWESAFVAFAFALHPQHVESVAWVTERKDVLSAFFWFLTTWLYLDYVDKPTAPRYLLSLAAFSLGLMSKQMLVTLPFALLLLDYWPIERLRASWRLVVEKIPYLALSVGASLITYRVQHDSGTVVSLFLPLSVRVSNALISYVGYLEQFFWPTGLSVFYPYNLTLKFPLWQVAGSATILIAVSVVVLRRRYLTVGWFWFLGTMVPVIGLVQVGLQARADRYAYIPTIGISIMVGWGAAEVVERWPGSKQAIQVASVAVCAVWLAVTWTQIQYWQNSIALFQHALSVTRNNYIADLNLGVVLVEKGRTNEALNHLYAAVEENPAMIDGHDTLGALLAQIGRTNEAAAEFAKSIQLQPNDVEAHFNLGNVLLDQGKLAAAAEEFGVTLRLSPHFALAHFGLGASLVNMGRIDESIAQFQEALRLDPTIASAREGLGKALEAKKAGR